MSNPLDFEGRRAEGLAAAERLSPAQQRELRDWHDSGRCFAPPYPFPTRRMTQDEWLFLDGHRAQIALAQRAERQRQWEATRERH